MSRAPDAQHRKATAAPSDQSPGEPSRHVARTLKQPSGEDGAFPPTNSANQPGEELVSLEADSSSPGKSADDPSP